MTCVILPSIEGPFLLALEDFLNHSCDSVIRLVYPYHLLTFLSIFSIHMFLLWSSGLQIYNYKNKSKHSQNLYIDCIFILYIFLLYNRVLWMNVCIDIWSHMLHGKEYNRRIYIYILQQYKVLSWFWSSSSRDLWIYDCKSILSQDRSFCNQFL